jgi:hypothetical protein
MSQEQIQLVEKTQRLLHGPLKHVRAAALAAALLPLASVAVSPASAQTVCPSGGATISGVIWNDVNNNGIQDAGEAGIAGVSVSLGGVTTSTDANGFYSLTYDGSGSCELAVQIPNSASPSPSNVGSDDAVDSDGVSDTFGNSVVFLTVDSNGTIVTDYDFGFFKPSLTQPGTGTPGYWKNHPEAWTLDPIVIGGVSYTKAQAIAWLDVLSKDKTTTMFSSLVAAKLNVAFGTDPSCVASTILLADAWMTKPPTGYGPVGSGVEASSYAWKIGEPLHRLMDNYNNGMLCAPHRN